MTKKENNTNLQETPATKQVIISPIMFSFDKMRPCANDTSEKETAIIKQQEDIVEEAVYIKDVFQCADDLMRTLTEKIDKLNAQYKELDQSVEAIPENQHINENELALKIHPQKSAEDDFKSNIAQEHMAGFIRASLHFLSDKYKQEDIKTICLSRIEEYVQTRMQNHHQVDCLYKTQEYIQVYVEEFVKKYLDMCANEKTEKELCDELSISFGQDKIEIPELYLINEFMKSAIQKNRFDQLDALQRRLDVEKVKLELVKIIKLQTGSSEQEQERIAKEKEGIEKDKKKFEEEQEKITKEKEGIESERNRLNEERRRFEEEKEQLAKRNKEIDKILKNIGEERRPHAEEESKKDEKIKKLEELKLVKEERKKFELEKKKFEVEKKKLEVEKKKLEVEKKKFEVEKKNIKEKEKMNEQERRSIEDDMEILEKRTEDNKKLKREMKKQQKLYKETEDKHKKLLSATERLKKQQNELLEQVEAEEEYAKKVRMELESIEKECRKTFVGTKRKSEEIENELVELDEEEPAPKRSNRGRPKEDATPSQPVLEKKYTIKELLQSKTSPLKSANLKDLVPDILGQLNNSEKKDLAAYLPSPDTTEAGVISDEFLEKGNNVFWESTSAWQTLLSAGSFDEDLKKKKAGLPKEPFKDDQYEEYWGEKIEKAVDRKKRRSRK